MKRIISILGGFVLFGIGSILSQTKIMGAGLIGLIIMAVGGTIFYKGISSKK